MSKAPESFTVGFDHFFVNLVWKCVNFLVRSEAKQSCTARLSKSITVHTQNHYSAPLKHFTTREHGWLCITHCQAAIDTKALIPVSKVVKSQSTYIFKRFTYISHSFSVNQIHTIHFADIHKIQYLKSATTLSMALNKILI